MFVLEKSKMKTSQKIFTILQIIFTIVVMTFVVLHLCNVSIVNADIMFPFLSLALIFGGLRQFTLEQNRKRDDGGYLKIISIITVGIGLAIYIGSVIFMIFKIH